MKIQNFNYLSIYPSIQPLKMQSDDNQTASSSSKHAAGRPESVVWNHFYKTAVDKSRGHFSATCHYCEQQWSRDKPNILENHLASKYVFCSPEI